MALHDRPLFDDPIEGHIGGPMMPTVQATYRTPDWWLPVTVEPDVAGVPAAVIDHLTDAWDEYGDRPGDALAPIAGVRFRGRTPAAVSRPMSRDTNTSPSPTCERTSGPRWPTTRGSKRMSKRRLKRIAAVKEPPNDTPPGDLLVVVSFRFFEHPDPVTTTTGGPGYLLALC